MQDGTRINLAPAVRLELERTVRDGSPGPARRARIVLARAAGLSLSDIASDLDMHRDSVRRWLVRFRARAVAGLLHGNAGKPKNVVFDASTRDEIRRRASVAPSDLGENYPTWSLFKLRAHLIRHGVVQTISVERLRQFLQVDSYSSPYWHNARPPLAPLRPEVRDQLVRLADHPQPEQAIPARAVLAVADGGSVRQVANALRLRKGNLRLWIDCFRAAGVAGLAAAPRGSDGRQTTASSSASSAVASPPAHVSWSVDSPTSGADEREEGGC